MTGDNKQKGFSMVELLITGVVFSIIFGVATMTFVNTVRVQKYNMAHQQLLDQTSYAVEYMARSLRMAKVDDGSCGVGNGINYKIIGGGKGIVFKNYNDECVEFFWDNAVQQLTVNISGPPVGVGYRLNGALLNSSNYPVTMMEFSIDGQSRADNLQPRATIFMQMQDTRLMNNNPKITVQTTVSQRNLDE
jgi:prepilin-type N-terminal cleavage/methylation domain-containing protein